MTNSKKTGKALDLDVVLSHVDGDRQLLKELSAMFLEDCPNLLDEAKKSIQKADYESLERAAHTLSGRLAFFGLHKARERALELETTGRNKDSSHVLEAFAAIEDEMESILPEFEFFIREQSV